MKNNKIVVIDISFKKHKKNQIEYRMIIIHKSSKRILKSSELILNKIFSNVNQKKGIKIYLKNKYKL